MLLVLVFLCPTKFDRILSLFDLIKLFHIVIAMLLCVGLHES